MKNIIKKVVEGVDHARNLPAFSNSGAIRNVSEQTQKHLQNERENIRHQLDRKVIELENLRWDLERNYTASTTLAREEEYFHKKQKLKDYSEAIRRLEQERDAKDEQIRNAADIARRGIQHEEAMEKINFHPFYKGLDLIDDILNRPDFGKANSSTTQAGPRWVGEDDASYQRRLRAQEF